MEKLKIFLISITPLLLVSLIGLGIYNNLEQTKIKTICKNLKLIDVNIDHSQTLDTIEVSKKQGIQIPDTIINFDTHSDMFVYKKINSKSGAQIWDWLNEFFAKNKNANTLYWVMPEEEAKDERMQWNFTDYDEPGIMSAMDGNSKKKAIDVNPNVHQIPYVQYFWLDTKSGWMEEIISNKDEDQLKNPRYKKIQIVTCTEKTLPNFKGKNVILSLDMDYISNSGFDTIEDWRNDRESKEIEIALSKMLSTIRCKNIRPEIITLTLSPQYVPKNDHEQIENFAKFFLKYSGKKDGLNEYTHKYGLPQTKPGQKKYKGI